METELEPPTPRPRLQQALRCHFGPDPSLPWIRQDGASIIGSGFWWKREDHVTEPPTPHPKAQAGV